MHNNNTKVMFLCDGKRRFTCTHTYTYYGTQVSVQFCTFYTSTNAQLYVLRCCPCCLQAQLSKKQQRLIKNREAASASRQKKKEV